MIRYSNYQVVFQEFPGEVTLAINLTLCPHKCPGCHSPWLQEGNSQGELLTPKILDDMISKYVDDITCVGFMGGDNDVAGLLELAEYIRGKYPQFKLGWYSGYSSFSDNMMEPFDYCKFGPYKQDRGGLDQRTTNQEMYMRIGTGPDSSWENITQKFWR